MIHEEKWRYMKKYMINKNNISIGENEHSEENGSDLEIGKEVNDK